MVPPFVPRKDGAALYGVVTWYQLCARISGYSDEVYPGGTNNPPFMYFDAGKDNSTSNNHTDPSIAAQLLDTNFQRTITMAKQAALLVMIAEAANGNFVDGTDNNNMYMTRLGARHGMKTRDGFNAFTNIAFFDGHVSLYATAPIEAVSGGDTNIPQSMGLVFILSRQ